MDNINNQDNMCEWKDTGEYMEEIMEQEYEETRKANLEKLKDYDSYYGAILSNYQKYELFSYIDFFYYQERGFSVFNVTDKPKEYQETLEIIRELEDSMSMKFIEDFMKACEEDKENYNMLYDMETYDRLIVLLEKKRLEIELKNF